MASEEDVAKLTDTQAAAVLKRATSTLAGTIELPDTEADMRQLLAELLRAHGGAHINPLAGEGLCSGDEVKVALSVINRSLSEDDEVDRRMLDNLIATPPKSRVALVEGGVTVVVVVTACLIALRTEITRGPDGRWAICINPHRRTAVDAWIKDVIGLCKSIFDSSGGRRS